MPSRPTDRVVTGEQLALYRGQPVRDNWLPYGHHSIDEEDIAAVVQVMRSDWITQGPKVEEFERAVAEFCGAKYGVAFSSGTASLHGACAAVGLGPGDEAITTPFTFVATANCLLYQGATPVFADVCSDTLNIDPINVDRCIGPRTKAILLVDYAGHPADLEVFLKLAERTGLVVVEDACHALGAEYNGRRVGGISDMTVFSFHPVKHITTGEGGMVTTNDVEFARRLRMFRNHGIDSDARKRETEGRWSYDMVTLGYNYRMTDIGSALGLSQLQRLATNLARRQEIARRYTEVFENLRGIVPLTVRPDVVPAFHLYPIRLDLPILNCGRDEFLRALRAENVGANVHYVPVHMQPYYRRMFGYRGGEFPVAEKESNRLISLPIFQSMSDQDVDDVIEAVRKLVTHYAH